MRRFIECLIPITACNLKCSYCYVIQNNRRNTTKALFEKYTPEYIGKALSITRLGGVSLISICGAGETTAVVELPQISNELLKQGHFVNITTNGTLTERIQLILDATEGMHARMLFSFSFHYLELRNKNLLDVFFNNIQKVRDSGCSFVLQINLVDEYIPYWNDIKHISLERVGALPQVALTRIETTFPYKILTNLSNEEYYKVGKEMSSPLFDYTFNNFNRKQTGFCYAGYWSATLNLCTGEMTGCYGQGIHQNIYKDINKPIRWRPIGCNCKSSYCVISSHFMSQGIIPACNLTDTYCSLRNREDASWYTDEAKQFLGCFFSNTNKVFSPLREKIIDLTNILSRKIQTANHLILKKR